MRASLSLIVLGAFLIAGCAQPPATSPTPSGTSDDSIPGLPAAYSKQFPKLRCVDGSFVRIFDNGWSNESKKCNIEMTPTNLGNEVTIAVNPKNPDNVVGGAKDYTQPAAGQCVWDGIYTTTDGGKTWLNQQLPGSNWAHMVDPMTPVTPISKHWCATDPVVAFGPDGSVYYSAMGYQCDPVSASPTGAGTLPDGGLNDWAFNCVQMYVLKSEDEGKTWPQITALTPAGSYPVSFNDRQWLHVDPKTGAVYVGWIVFHTATVENWFYYSTDGGKTFTGPQIVSSQDVQGQRLPAGGGQGTMITSGPAGEVYMSWDCAEESTLVKSVDGGRSFGLPTKVPTTCNSDVLYHSNENPRGLPRTPDAPSPAADYSAGPYSGNVYFVARSKAFDGRADIAFVRSTDGGKTWDAPKKLNDDKDPKTAHFFAAISVNPNGVIDVVWYDQRRDANHYLIDIYYTYSLDGGDTWAPNARITEVATDPKYSHHQNGMVFIGDYIDIDSSVDYAHPVWVDTRNGISDVYTAWIQRPSQPQLHAA